ncbi:MAG: ABC transporter permease subunit [Sedimentisphaerales bacterium]|nr:ABC transporter permease subunit [Sedimentisphaerales bacterium]
MTVHLTQSVIDAIQSGWLTGPIFDKELRVSSRRRRNYALRFVYILVLTIFVATVWWSVVRNEGSAVIQRSRMQTAAQQIVVSISLFQFIAMQLLAIIMLSDSISDEVDHRTLGLLMTTPISGLQIVMGKLLSKLLQLVLLLAISLPVLAIVRIFGGISWDYLLSSLCVTLTTAIFAGSLSLLFSVRNRFAYGVIIRTLFTLGCFYLVVLPPLLGLAVSFLLGNFRIPGRVLRSVFVNSVLVSLNPASSIVELTRQVFSPGGPSLFSLPLHCALMLGLSATILIWAVARVRTVALRQASGQLTGWEPGRRRRGANMPSTANGSVRRVQGPPVAWRELRAPFIQGIDNRNSRIGLAAAVLGLLLTYLASAAQGLLDEGFTHVSYALLFIFLGLAFNVVFAATRITAEKESQTWSILLVSSLSDYEILMGKAISAFRRCLPIWGLLAGHIVLFVLAGYIHPIAALHLGIVVTWVTCFVTGAGLYFSTRFRRTTAAVVASSSLMLGLWGAGPVVAGVLSMATKNERIFTDFMLANPLVQTEQIMGGAAGSRNASLSFSSLEYGGEHVIFDQTPGMFGSDRMTAILLTTAGLYMLAGLLFFWLAKRRLRQNVF